MANPNTQRRRRSKFSTSNVVPWMVGKKAGPARFGDLKGSVLVRDKLTSICPRSGRDGSIFKFKSGEEEVAWWRSRVLRTSRCTSACRLSSRTAGYVGTLPEGPVSALFSMQCSSLARTTEQCVGDQQKKKRPSKQCNQSANQGSSPGFSLPVSGPANSALRDSRFAASPPRHIAHRLRSQSPAAYSHPIPSHIDAIPTFIPCIERN